MVRTGLQASNPNLPTIKSEGRLAVVEERSTKPPGQPKFTRKVHTPQDNTNKNGTEEKIDASTLCQQMLRDGYVQSYVDFYHLTHRLDNTSTNAPSSGNNVDVVDNKMTTMISIPLKDLLFIRDALVQAEVSRRRGNTVSVYDAYNQLADFYVNTKDHKTGFFFHEKCLEVAQLTNDIRAEMSANHSLGVINQMMLNFDRARMHHEKHELLAISMDIFEEVAKANAELYKVYITLAKKLEQDGKLESALEMYEKCLEAGKKSWSKASEAEANGRIGSLLLNSQRVQESVPYLKQYSSLVSDLGHAESRCKASTALALAYDLLNLPEKALTELTLVHSISEQAGDMFLQAQACRALGTLYSKVNKLDAAVSILNRHFQLLKSLVQAQVIQQQQQQKQDSSKKGGDKGKEADKKAPKMITTLDLDLARAYIGLSKGNVLLGAYIYGIESDLTSLLDWKLNRTDIVVPVPPPVVEREGEGEGEGATKEEKTEGETVESNNS